jgi:hypothetical protein
MEYLEELDPGNSFSYRDTYYILSSDFKKNGSRMCLSIKDGSVSWLSGSTIVDIIPLCYLNESNTIIPLRETKNKYDVK